MKWDSPLKEVYVLFTLLARLYCQLPCYLPEGCEKVVMECTVKEEITHTAVISEKIKPNW
jgi:hypothetical protein